MTRRSATLSPAVGLLLPLLPLLLLTGCGRQSASTVSAAPSGSSAAAGSVVAADSACQEYLHPATSAPDERGFDKSPRLQPGFVPVAVLWCTKTTRPVPGDGTWNYLVGERATTGIDAFVAAMRRPDEPRAGACNAVLVVPAWVAFEDADGRVVHASYPVNGCDQPQGDATREFDALTFVPASETRLDQDQTEPQAALEDQATAVGCVSAFKDMVVITDGDHAGPRSAPDPILAPSTDVVTVCRFAAGRDKEGSPLLTFVSGEKLSAAATAALQGELAASGPAAPCSTEHTTVTGLFTAHGGWALVETDGCHRVESGQSAGWRQATPGLLAQLG